MQKMIVIAGPCVIETEDMIMTTAEKLRDITDKFDIDYYFKASLIRQTELPFHPSAVRGLRRVCVF